MSRTSEATPSAGRDGDSHAAGSSSSEAPGIRAPVVASTPLDPALVDLIKVAPLVKIAYFRLIVENTLAFSSA